MANGSTRIALARMQLKKESAVSEQAELKKMDNELPSKIPLKASGWSA